MSIFDIYYHTLLSLFIKYTIFHLKTVNYISTQHPTSPLAIIGWSAGSHLMTKMLQKVGKDTPLVAAISVSGCFDLPKVIDNITKNENPTYRLFLSQQLKIW